MGTRILQTYNSAKMIYRFNTLPCSWQDDNQAHTADICSPNQTWKTIKGRGEGNQQNLNNETGESPAGE